ncbi:MULTISPECIES: hypothetical protein [Paenibacillus]|uniref:Uncharacterized protein n=1 Tax=Paenibacillus vandeheii TaxID=3035917 RepID=A0ABT8JFS6_9BACL|nr:MULTISPECIES: hypothetical protein [Paenibacillus]MDN4603934.1 hypothetical protein [Paenibacillus vandeheii]OXS57147.1 hypothetical protein B1B00_15810 [Bacillus sp. DSM 27956]PRX73903.1 hypothetical protein B0G93_11821 [Bacillus sp. V-88]SLK23979.1 hypothetical protein SAMN06295884_11821 [Bacillus sp. V-88]
MSEQTQGTRKGINPILLTVLLVVASIVILMVGRQFPNSNLWVWIILYLIIDIGFIVSMILGIKTKDKPLMVFSILSNTVFFILLSIWIFLLALANGISEP